MGTDEQRVRGRRGPSPRQAAEISSEPKNEALFKFLVNLFEDGFPEKIVLAAVFGAKGQRLGPPIKEWTYKPNEEKPKHEAHVTRANLILQFAQNECDVLGRSAPYGVFAYDLARGPTYYSRTIFRLAPSGASQEQFEQRGGFDDDENGVLPTKLLTSLLESERRDKRWLMELVSNVVTGAMERDGERIASLEDQHDKFVERSIKYVNAYEEAVSRKDEREQRLKREAMKDEMIQEAFTLAKSFLPVAKIYLTKGKIGVPEGLKAFLDSLSTAEGEAVFGKWDPATSQRLQEGVLNLEQCGFFLGVMKGQIDPARITEFATMIEPGQLEAIQQIVPMEKLGKLFMLVETARKVKEKVEGAAQEAEGEAAGT